MATHFGGSLTCGGASGGRCPRCLAAKAPPQEPQERVLGAFWDTPIKPRTRQNSSVYNSHRSMGVFDSGRP